MKLCRRKTDGAMFRASHPEGYTEADAVADCLSGQPTFFFRRVQYTPRQWWHLRGRWTDTGEIWKPKSGEFEVVDA